MMSDTELVVTIFMRKSRVHPLGFRLHRANCPTLRPSTRTFPYDPDLRLDRKCQRCKPVLPGKKALP